MIFAHFQRVCFRVKGQAEKRNPSQPDGASHIDPSRIPLGGEDDPSFVPRTLMDDRFRSPLATPTCGYCSRAGLGDEGHLIGLDPFSGGVLARHLGHDDLAQGEDQQGQGDDRGKHDGEFRGHRSWIDLAKNPLSAEGGGGLRPGRRAHFSPGSLKCP